MLRAINVCRRQNTLEPTCSKFVALVSVFALACGRMVSALLPSTGRERVVGGGDAAIEEVPYQAGLILFEMIVCGGSILSADVVVSAAHCVIAGGPSYKIRAGTNTVYPSTDDDGQIVGVSSIVIHPQFNFWYTNCDICLFFLALPLTLGAKAYPIPLPAQGQMVADNTPAIISGWGKLIEGGVPISNPLVLQKAIVPIVNQDICVSRYGTEGFTVTPQMLCAGFLEKGGKGTCQGDSGGPLVADGVLFGVTSCGIGCARAGFPGIFTRVSSFSDWIKHQMLWYQNPVS